MAVPATLTIVILGLFALANARVPPPQPGEVVDKKVAPPEESFETKDCESNFDPD